MAVYFIRNRRTGSYKIGYSVDPGSRIRALQTANEDDLEIVLIMSRAGQGTEKALHDRWDYLQLRGEWFKSAPEIESYIQTETIKEAAYKQSGLAGLETYEWFLSKCEQNNSFDRWLNQWVRIVRQ